MTKTFTTAASTQALPIEEKIDRLMEALPQPLQGVMVDYLDHGRIIGESHRAARSYAALRCDQEEFTRADHYFGGLKERVLAEAQEMARTWRSLGAEDAVGSLFVSLVSDTMEA